MLNSLRKTFAKSDRLLTSKDYQLNSFTYHRPSQALCVWIKPNEQGHARLGLILAKKQIRKANKRNRIKRIVRESFRHHKDLLQNRDIVIGARAGLERWSNQTLRQFLDAQWAQLAV
ncbi:MAG: ribonuclease P protein component [Gammaproteobacteria bacterium GWF2_41_13]|nr:MAG: ribonuclease P protein component [Gammaproteobacteria bacterium GWF2_41_13]